MPNRDVETVIQNTLLEFIQVSNVRVWTASEVFRLLGD